MGKIRFILVGILVLFLVFGVQWAFSQPTWIIDGNRVYVDDPNVYISVEPHTLHSSGWIYLNFTSKVYTGDIDMVWGFNTTEVRPKKAELYHPHNVSWETTHSRIFYNVSGYSDTTEPCKYGYDYNTYKKLITYTQISDFDNQTNKTVWNTTTAVVCFDSYENLGNNDYKITWHQEHTKTVNWLDISDRFSDIDYNYGDMNKWYYVTNIPIQKNVQYTMRAYVKVPVSLEPSSGKYWVAFKPSSESLHQAIQNGHLYYLDPWWNTSWQYRKPITIDSSKVDSDLTDFPVLVKLNSSNIDYSKTQDSGQDIRFVAWDNTTELDYEIELWNESGNSYVWVKIPSVSSSSDTKFWIYYGNPSATDGQNPSGVWDSNYAGIWHLSETETNTREDSTSNSNDGTPHGGVSDATGLSDGADDFDGTDDYINIPEDSTLKPTSAITIEAVVYIPNTLSSSAVIVKNDPGNLGYAIEGSSTKFWAYIGGSWYDAGGVTLSLNEWHYVVGTYDGSNMRFYVDGAEDDSVAVTGNIEYGTGTDMAIGRDNYNPGSSTRYFEGIIDEVRISSIARSSAWLKASYESERDNLLTFGSEESGNLPPTISYVGVTQYSPANSTQYPVTPTFEANITDPEGDYLYVYLYYNGTQINATGTNTTPYKYSVTTPTLGAGMWNITWEAYDGISTSTDTFWYEITKNVSLCSLSFSPSKTITYLTNLTVTCSCTNPETTATLWRNGTNVTDENNTPVLLGAGSYFYKCNVTETENYTSASTNDTVTVNKADSQLSLSASPGWTMTFGQTATISCTARSEAGTPTLKVDDVIVSNPYSFQPTIGEYDVECSISDSANFTPSSASNTLRVVESVVCTSTDTYAFYKNITTTSNITTLDFTTIVNNGFVRKDLADVKVDNVTSVWRNITDGNYYIVVNNTGLSSFKVEFGNYYVTGNKTEHPITSNITTIGNYTQESIYTLFTLYDELTRNKMYPPNSTVALIISCENGENYIEIQDGDTKFPVATIQNLDKAVVQVKYTADSYYSRQLYLPSAANTTALNFYLVDAWEHAVDRIDFSMIDIDYYDSKLIIYKPAENGTSITISEGYFDSDHSFSAYLREDADYWLKTYDSTNGYVEFGRITVVAPGEKTLGDVEIQLQPNTQLISDNILMNAYTNDNRTTLYVQYQDSTNQTDNVTVVIYHENGTVFDNTTYYANTVNVQHNITDYQNQSFTVSFIVHHQTFGNSPVTYSMIVGTTTLFDLGAASYIYNLFSLFLLLGVAGVGAKKSIVGSSIIFMIMVLVLWGIGWLPSNYVLFGLVGFLLILGILAKMKEGESL